MYELKRGMVVTHNGKSPAEFSISCEPMDIEGSDEFNEFVRSIIDLMTDIDKAGTAILRGDKEGK